jgi:tetratricopeptide (TPR) repeat protein
MKKLLGLFVTIVISFHWTVAQASYRSDGSFDLAAGVAAFQENRLHDAMKSFLTVLQEDPENRRAHAYVELITQKIRSEQERFTDERRLDILRAAAFQLEPKDTKQLLLREEIQLSSSAQSKKESKRWRNLIEESTVQRGLGHLFNAYDLTLRVLAQNPAFPEAQQELSEIQMAASQRLTLESGLSVSERFVLQGFYAYSEANYAEAIKAWEKAESILAQTYPSSEQTQYVNRFRFAYAGVRLECCRRAGGRRCGSLRWAEPRTA